MDICVALWSLEGLTNDRDMSGSPPERDPCPRLACPPPFIARIR